MASTVNSSYWSQAGTQESPQILHQELITYRQGPIDRLRTDLLLDSEDPADQHMAVNAIEIVNGAVTAAKLAPDTITDLQIADNSITGLSLATGSVKSAEIANGDVKTADLADASNDSSAPTGVITAKIENSAITTPKLSNLSVTTSKLAGADIDNATTGAVRAVTATALGDGAVTTRSLFAGSITDDKLDPGAGGVLARVSALRTNFDDFVLNLATDDGTAPNAGSNRVHWNNLNGVPSGFADGNDDVDGGIAAGLVCSPACIDSDEIVAVNASKLTGTISVDRLADGSITGGQLTGLGAPEPGSKIALGTITGEATPDNSGGPTGNIALKSIGADNLADGAVTADKLTANAVYSNAMGAGQLPNDGTAREVATADINIPGSTGSHSVLVNGQTVLSCAGICTGILTWALVDDGGTPVGPSRTVTFGGPGDLPIFVSALDTNVASGSTGYTYSLVLTYTTVDADVFTADTSDITVADLGGS